MQFIFCFICNLFACNYLFLLQDTLKTLKDRENIGKHNKIVHGIKQCAVHPVQHTAVPGQNIAKVLDVKAAF